MALTLATAPYEIYIHDLQETGRKGAERNGVCANLQIFVEEVAGRNGSRGPTGTKLPSEFGYQIGKTLYRVNVVERGPNRQLFIFARNAMTGDFVVPDDGKACPSSANKLNIEGLRRR